MSDPPRPDERLDSLGRAARVRRGGVELWHMDDARIAARLVSLGEAGVGGFREAGDASAGIPEGPWIARREVTPTLANLAKEARLAWRDALRVAHDLSRALQTCERGGLFPGALRPDQIVLAPSGAWFAAEPLVRAIVGAQDAGRASDAGARWTPPEQAAGEAWDGAANRYVLGLVLYRLIAGVLPFGGAGVRHAFEEQRAGAPPFADAIARELRPGVQAFVLRLLDPSRQARPGDAGAIAEACEELLSEARTQLPSTKTPPPGPMTVGSRGGRETSPPSPLSAGGEGEPTVTRSPPSPLSASGEGPGVRFRGRRGLGAESPRRPMAWLPVFVGAVVACFALVARAYRSDTPAATDAVRPVAPLRSASAAECAPCHAREVAEWERSVMAHAVKSPLFGALESLVEEQVGRELDCPEGAGVLRAAGADVCRARGTGITVTGSGGERWCVNCHSPGDNLDRSLPAWSAGATGSKRGRAPVRDLLSPLAMEGISCASCHETAGPVASHATGGRGTGAYEGNPTWISAASGQLFLARPEDGQGRPGIANSGYRLDPGVLLGASGSAPGEAIVHRRPPGSASAYLRSSEFCGACHDVRLFGSDVLGARASGEHFKRLRNAYSEWRTWSDDEARHGRKAPGCQGCHMSLYPGVCAPGGSGSSAECPGGTHFEARAPGQTARGLVAPSSTAPSAVASHYFTSVDIPLTESLPDAFVDDATLDPDGQAVGLRARRDMLLRHTFRFAIGDAKRAGDTLEIPIEIENTGAGHRVPAGFSQERETWVEMTVRDARGRVVYEVGKVDGGRGGEPADLRDKTFLRITTDDGVVDGLGRPLGLFGADVVDGPDVPRWSPSPSLGGTRFRGRGLINLQNGFLRCVRCIGRIDDAGVCQPGAGQGATRADRFEDAPYDPDTGVCSSNLTGGNELFETYFPVGALDAERGLAKAPDAIIDTRSAPPGVPLTYTYEIDASGRPGPFSVEARLRFRSFPPYLVRAFSAYEASKSARGNRPSGPQVVPRMLRRIEVVDLAAARTTVP
jgi:hypothetical protein